MMCTYVYKKKRKKKKGLLDGHDVVPGVSLLFLGPDFFPLLGIGSFPLCLSVHFVGVLAQFLSKEKGGGGTEVFLG